MVEGTWHSVQQSHTGLSKLKARNLPCWKEPGTAFKLNKFDLIARPLSLTTLV